MKLKNIKVKLTDRDRLILTKYANDNLCTDLHGNGCNINKASKN